MFIERLEMYISSGMQLGLAVAHAGHGLSKKQCLSLDHVRDQVEGGLALSSSLARQIGYPPSVIGIVSCGESSGNLPQALRLAHSLLEREDDLRKKCASAMTYPAVIGVAAGTLTIGLVRGIMPQITPLLTGMHADLPMLTKIVIGASDLIGAYGIWAVLFALALAMLLVWSYRKLNPFRSLAHRAIIHVPIIGELIERYSLAVFFHSMGALTESGMAADAAFEEAIIAVGLLPLRDRLAGSIKIVVHGGSLASVFADGMPRYIAPLVSAGEASGNLSNSLSRAANILDKDIDHSLKRMTALIEPVMMIFMGTTVGGIALSIMMPIYDISKNLQH
jgi:type II secretory pathway component PulF